MAEKDEKNKEGFFQKVKHFFVHDKKTDDEYDRSILNPEPSKDVNVSRPIPTGETFASNVHSKNFDTNYKDLDQPGTSRVRPISDVNTESNQDMIEKSNVEHSGTRAKPTTGITGVNEHNLQMGEPYVHHVGHSKPISSRDNKDFEKTDKKDKNKPKKNKSGSNLTEKDKEYEKSHKKDKNKLGESKPKKNKSGSNLSEKERRIDEHQLGVTNPLSSGSSLGSNDTHLTKDTQQSNLGSNLNQIPSSSINQMPNLSNMNQIDQMPLSSINQMPIPSGNQMNQMPILSNMNQIDQIPLSSINQMPIPSGNQMNQMPILSNMNQIDQMPSSSINQMPLTSSNMNQMNQMPNITNLNQMPLTSNMNQIDQMPSSSINQMPLTSSNMNQMNQIAPSNLNQFPTPIQDAIDISIDQNKITLGETFVAVVEKGVGKDTDVHIYLNEQNPNIQNTRN